MRDTYTLYEAKAKLSALVRMVREGRPVVITVHGEPAVEMRAISPRVAGIQAHMDKLAERGILVRPERVGARPRAVERRPGALKRFLGDRN